MAHEWDNITKHLAKEWALQKITSYQVRNTVAEATHGL